MTDTTRFPVGQCDAHGANSGAIWHIPALSGPSRVRGYDMQGVEVKVPRGYRLETYPDGFDVWPSLWVIGLKLLHDNAIGIVIGFSLCNLAHLLT